MSKANGSGPKKRKPKKPAKPPVASDDDGRSKKDGRFGPGNTFAKGNPMHIAQCHFRKLVMSETTDEQLKQVWAKLVTLALAGEPWAIRELMDRVLGKAQQTVELTGDVSTTLEIVASGIDKLSKRLRKLPEVDSHRRVGLN